MTGSKFFVLNRELILQFGIDAALLLAELALCQDHFKDWFYKTQEHIQAETSLSPKLQLKAVLVLKTKGILKTKKVGMPAKTYYFIDLETLSLFLPNVETSLAKRDKQVTPKEVNKLLPKVETLIKNKEKKILKEDIINKVSKELQGFISDFFEYRKEIKKPFRSEISIETRINEFVAQAEKYGELAVIESIKNAIANGWQGTFISKEYLTKAKIYEPRKQQEQTLGFIQRATDFEL